MAVGVNATVAQTHFRPSMIGPSGCGKSTFLRRVKGTEAVEELRWDLRGDYTILIVTDNMAQARRASEEGVCMLVGRVVEHARTDVFPPIPDHSQPLDPSLQR